MGWPSLNIVIMAIGTREEVAPFLEIGKLLKHVHGHRVRIATHQHYRSLVRNDAGLEFYSIGTDAAELLFYGLNKWKASLASLQRIRQSMMHLFENFWRACVDASDDLDATETCSRQPFVADAIIATPPCYAHVHCAERLGIPLHIMTTNAEAPVKQIQNSQARFRISKANLINSLSYQTVEVMKGQFLGPLVNHLRVEHLGLGPISTFWSASQYIRTHIPQTYLWSQLLLPCSSDRGTKVDLAGFVPEQASLHEPSSEVVNFLNAGAPPIYIGFGSTSLPDRGAKFFSLVIDAIGKAGVRAVIDTTGVQCDMQSTHRRSVLCLSEAPLDWLLPRCGAVVHQGEPGITAMGLKHGRPTVTIPFCGDHFIWGVRVASAKAGALAPIPYKQLTADNLAHAIRQCLRHEAYLCAGELARNLRGSWNGAANAVASFHQSLPQYEGGRCIFLPDRLAVFENRLMNAKLSALATHILMMAGCLQPEDLVPFFQKKHPALASPESDWSSVVSCIVALGVQLTAAAALAGVAKFLVHALEAPFSLALVALFCLYSCVDLFHYLAGENDVGKQNQSTLLRIRSWQPHMYGLVVRVLDGLASLLTQPYAGSISLVSTSQGFSAGLLKSIIGFIFCGRTAVIAVVVLTVQALNGEMERWVRNKGKADVVFETRLRQGMQEFKGLAAEKSQQEVEAVIRDIRLKWETIINKEERWQPL